MFSIKSMINHTFINFLSIYDKVNIMGRKVLKEQQKKRKITISISPEINGELDDMKLNKSKLINWLLQEHFNEIISK